MKMFFNPPFEIGDIVMSSPIARTEFIILKDNEVVIVNDINPEDLFKGKKFYKMASKIVEGMSLTPSKNDVTESFLQEISL